MPKLIHLIFLIIYLFFTSFALANEAGKQKIQLVFAANMPDISGKNKDSYSQLYSLLKQTRQKEKNTIFAFGGGSIGPSPLASFDRGSHIIDILNTLEPDLMTVRKREFSYYEDVLTLRSYEAGFPFVISNLTDDVSRGNVEGLHDSVLINKNGIKIGFLSILEEEVIQEYLLTRIRMVESKEIIEEQAAKLRRQGAQFIVMVYAKKQPYYLGLLDTGIIDLIINARSDRDNAEPNTLSHPKIYSLTDDDKALIFELIWHTQNSKPQIVHQEVPLSNYPDDLATNLQIKDYTHRLNRLLNQHIGTLTVPINTLRLSVRTEENAFANLVADTLREYKNADVGFINGGAIRGDRNYPAHSSISRKDITAELPFRSRIILVAATGYQIKQTLEHGLSEVELINGRFPHASGLTFSYSLSSPVGKRVKEVLINGKAINLDKKYTVATSEYVARGGDGFTGLSDIINDGSNNLSEPLISDVVILNIQKLQNIAPQLDARAKRLD